MTQPKVSNDLEHGSAVSLLVRLQIRHESLPNGIEADRLAERILALADVIWDYEVVRWP